MDSAKQSAFTLIELMVVLVLISTVLFFAVPKIASDVFSTGQKKTGRWLLLTVKKLKAKALHEGKTYTLSCNIEDNKFLITHEGMGEEELQQGNEKGFNLPEGMQLLDVEMANSEITTQGNVDINFYGKGYSDRAIIHLSHGEEERMSFVVEPFLPNGEWLDRYLDFEDVRYDSLF